MNRMLFLLPQAPMVRFLWRANSRVWGGSDFQAFAVSPSNVTSIPRPRYSPTRSPRLYGVRAKSPRPWTGDRRTVYELMPLIQLCLCVEWFVRALGAGIRTGL